jgi:hypothetical protein
MRNYEFIIHPFFSSSSFFFLPPSYSPTPLLPFFLFFFWMINYEFLILPLIQFFHSFLLSFASPLSLLLSPSLLYSQIFLDEKRTFFILPLFTFLFFSCSPALPSHLSLFSWMKKIPFFILPFIHSSFFPLLLFSFSFSSPSFSWMKKKYLFLPTPLLSPSLIFFIFPQATIYDLQFLVGKMIECKMRIRQNWMQHRDFPGGHPSQYYSGPKALNFRVLMGSGVVALV